MKLDDDVEWSAHAGTVPDVLAYPETTDDDPSDDYPDGSFTPETERLTLPSSLAFGEIDRLSLQPVATIEIELRKGQINDSLESLRLALGEKSLCFRAEVRNADSQRTSQRAWDNVHKFDADARKHRNLYLHARSALRRLPVDHTYLDTLKDITEADMKMSADVTEENRFGQRSDVLAWFWRQGPNVEEEAVPSVRMQECKFNFYVY